MAVTDKKIEPGVKWSLFANSRVDIPILVAVAGLLYGIVVLTWQDCGLNARFHDLTLKNKDSIVLDLLHDRAHYLDSTIAGFKDLLTAEPADSTPIRDTMQNYIHARHDIPLSITNLSAFNIDTSLSFYVNYFSLDRKELLSAINKGKTELAVQARDTCCSPFPLNSIKHAKLTIDNHPKPLIEFFDANPLFGFWFVLSIAQMSLWSMLVCLAIGAVKSVGDIEPLIKYNFKNAIRITLIPLGVMLVFTLVLYFRLIKGTVINDDFFLKSYNTRMYWYSIPGYVAATICFGIFLFLTNKLEVFNKTAKKSGQPMETFTESYNRLKDAFRFVFTCTAVILSVYVIWLGVLFYAVNNLEACRFYYLSSGKQVLNYDFVYLMGMIHSVLLAIFYFPAQIQFNSLELTKTEKNTAGESSSVSKVFKGFGDVLGNILITASPLIITIIQKALASLFGE